EPTVTDTDLARQLGLEFLALGPEDPLARIHGGEHGLLDLVIDRRTGQRNRHDLAPERMSTKAAVLAAVIEQRLARSVAGVFNQSDENRVIALDVPGHRAALELRQRALDQRHAVTAQAVRHAVEFVEARRREAARDLFVTVAQEVDGEVPAVAQRRIAL